MWGAFRPYFCSIPPRRSSLRLPCERRLWAREYSEEVSDLMIGFHQNGAEQALLVGSPIRPTWVGLAYVLSIVLGEDAIARAFLII